MVQEIRIEVKRRGLTLERFAKKLGIGAITLRRIEKGKRIDPHINPGTEWACNVEGKCELKVKVHSIFTKRGIAAFSMPDWNITVTALERLKLSGIFVRGKE